MIDDAGLPISSEVPNDAASQVITVDRSWTIIDSSPGFDEICGARAIGSTAANRSLLDFAASDERPILDEFLIAAAEGAVGLGIVIAAFRHTSGVRVTAWKELKG